MSINLSIVFDIILKYASFSNNNFIFFVTLSRIFYLPRFFAINLVEKFTTVSLFQNWQFYLAFAFRCLVCHIAAKIAGPTGERSARWKNVLTAYARLEIGERLCKTWLAHFKCRNAKQLRRSRCIAVWGWIAERARARVQDIHICRKLVSSDLDYGTSCFTEIENLWRSPISRKRFLTRYRYDIIAILHSFSRCTHSSSILSIHTHYRNNDYIIM